MSLQLLRLTGPIVAIDFTAVSSGNTLSNQFLQNLASTSAPTTTETAGQTPAAVNFNLWRLQAALTVVGLQQVTMTSRVNGVSQASTATTVGTAAGATTTDLTTAILVHNNDQLSVLMTTPAADASNTRPRCWLVGAACNSI